jgi:hypothetical protein
MPGLDDYGALLRSGAASVPDYAADEARKQLAAVQIGQERRLEQAQQHELADEESFQGDLTSYLTNPTPQGASMLVLKHPKHAEQLKTGFEMQDKAKQDSDFRAMGEVYSAATAKKYDVAAALMQRRIEGDKQAGQDTSHDQMIYDALSSGDPVQQKAAVGMVGFTLSSIKPDKFNETYGSLNKDKGGFTLDAGATRYDSDGNVVVESPYIKTADGGILERDNPGGGDPASPGAATTAAPGGFDHAVEHVLANEGGYAARDMNGAPVNFGINQKANPGVDVKNLTKDQAKQIYHDKYWVPSGAESLPANMQAPYFDVYIRNPKFAKAALAKAGGDPEKFMDQADSYFQGLAAKPENQKYAHPYAVRDAKNRAIATGATEASTDHPTQGQAPPGYHWLTPPKPKDAPAGFRYKADGSTLEPIPGGPADDAGLDAPTVEFYAQQYLTTGTLPPMGMGKSATKTRQQIMKQAAKIAGADGLTGTDLAVQMAHYKAGVANISNLEKQLGTVSGNELTFAKNAQQVAELARKLPAQTGSRLLNTPIQTFLRQTNDPTVAALDVAIKTAANEYARLVTSSPSGAGTLSDSARMEYQGIIEGNFPLKQKLSALHQMSVDANNRSKSLRSTLQDTYAHLSDRAPELRGQGGNNAKSEGWITLPSGLKVRKIK